MRTLASSGQPLNSKTGVICPISENCFLVKSQLRQRSPRLSPKFGEGTGYAERSDEIYEPTTDCRFDALESSSCAPGRLDKPAACSKRKNYLEWGCFIPHPVMDEDGGIR